MFHFFYSSLKKILQSSFKKGNQETQASIKVMSLIHSQKHRPQITWKLPTYLWLWGHLTLWVGSQLSGTSQTFSSFPTQWVVAPGDNLQERRPWVGSWRRERRSREQRRGERPKGVQGLQKQKASVCIRGVWGKKEPKSQQHPLPVPPPFLPPWRGLPFPAQPAVSPWLPSLAVGAPPGQGGSGETSSPSTCTLQPVVH